ncbi:hypothetical protein GQ53DRAFT_451191 [Thozetella sp. PMI_491]|nr:hypothetical protein GQ53DRAFT_451191 [Thozetella sp. PMI_491]
MPSGPVRYGNIGETPGSLALVVYLLSACLSNSLASDITRASPSLNHWRCFKAAWLGRLRACIVFWKIPAWFHVLILFVSRMTACSGGTHPGVLPSLGCTASCAGRVQGLFLWDGCAPGRIRVARAPAEGGREGGKGGNEGGGHLLLALASYGGHFRIISTTTPALSIPFFHSVPQVSGRQALWLCPLFWASLHRLIPKSGGQKLFVFSCGRWHRVHRCHGCLGPICTPCPQAREQTGPWADYIPASVHIVNPYIS